MTKTYTINGKKIYSPQNANIKGLEFIINELLEALNEEKEETKLCKTCSCEFQDYNEPCLDSFHNEEPTKPTKTIIDVSELVDKVYLKPKKDPEYTWGK